jgi:hypothetical protein
MELMDRYIYDIGRRLPAKQRKDIEKELGSLLADALDARSEGHEPTEADILSVITDFGAPAEVAARYNGERYLIGPRLFDLYFLILRIVLAVTAFGLVAALIVSLAVSTFSGQDAFRKLLLFIPNLFNAGISSFGFITFIFFLVERFVDRDALQKELRQQKWSPQELPQIPGKADLVGKAGPIVTICFTLLGLALFNLNPDWLAFTPSLNPGSDFTFIPLLAKDALAAYLPLWNIGWVITLVIQIILLQRGRWELGTRIAYILQQFFSIGVLVYMMVGPSLIAGDEFLKSLHLESLAWWFTAQFRWTFAIIIAVIFFDAMKTAWLAIRSRR